MSAIPAQAPAARLVRLIAALCAVVAARIVRPGRPGLAGPLIILIWTRLRRIAGRVERLAARVAAGPLPPPRRRPAQRRPATPRPATPRPARPQQSVAIPSQPLPAGRGWLVRLVPAAAFGAGQLRALLDDPAMQALITAAPQIGRSLRPLCRMLGVSVPPSLRRPPPAAPPPPRATPARRPPARNPAQAEPRPRHPPSRAPAVARRACGPPVSA